MDMSTGKKPHPTVAELFGLERIEGWHRPEDPPSLYCFRPAGLLPMEQILAVDAISGVTQVWTASSEKILVAETRLDLVETRLFTALVLSYPSSVARYQMRQEPEQVIAQGNSHHARID